jgi:peptide/nickel transport system substrate-binding protein
LTAPSCNQGFFAMNTKVAPWNNVHVRRAAAYAINRADIITAEGGYAVPDYTMIPPAQLASLAPKAQVDALTKSLPTYGLDLAKARQELAKSPYPGGFTSHLDTIQYGSYVNTAEAISGDLSRIGIDLKVNVIPIGAWVKEIFGGAKSYPTQYSWFVCGSPDPGFVPGISLSSKAAGPSGSNLANYTSAQVDGLIATATGQTSPAKRFASYSKLLTIVAADEPYVPIYAGETYAALDQRFTWPTFNGYSSLSRPYITQIKPR